MKQVLDSICDYRRCCWNQSLETWNQMYDLHCIDKSYKTPNERAVRNELVENKQDWQYKYSSRVLQQAILDLGNAWQHFLSKSQFDWGKPKFKTKINNIDSKIVSQKGNSIIGTARVDSIEQIGSEDPIKFTHLFVFQGQKIGANWKISNILEAEAKKINNK